MEYDVFWSPARVSEETSKRAKKLMMYFGITNSQFTRDALEIYIELLEEKLKEVKKIKK